MLSFLAAAPIRSSTPSCIPPTKRPTLNRAPRWRCATSYSKKKERPARARELSELLTVYSRDGDANNIMRVVAFMEETDGFRMNAVNYSSAVSGLGKAKKYREAFHLLANMRDKGIPPTPVTLRIVTRICMQWADKHTALESLDALVQWWLMTANSPDVDSWRYILIAYGKLGDVQRLKNALALRGLGIPPKDTFSLNILLGAHGMSSSDIFAAFGYMLTSSHIKHQPDTVSYNALLRAVLRDTVPFRNYIPMCRAILDSMKSRQISPDTVTWTSLSRLLVDSHDSESLAADTLLRHDIVCELRSYWRAISSNRDNPPDLILYNAMISTCATVCFSPSGAQLAVEILSHLRRNQRVIPDIRTVNSILACISRAEILKAGTEDVVMDTMVILSSANCANQYTLCSAISCCGTSSENAMKLLRMGARKGIVNGAMVNAALKTYGDKISPALEFWKRLRQDACMDMRRAVRHVQCYEALLRICGRASRPDLALRIVYVFIKEKSALGADRKSYCNLIHSFYRGAREFGVEEKLKSFLSPSFVNHLRLACNCNDMSELENIPIERVRIKY